MTAAAGAAPTAPHLARAAAAGEVRRVLAARVGRVGDTLHVLPALELLRAGLPGARVTLLCAEGAAPLARGAAHEVVAWPRGRGPLGRWRRGAIARALARAGPWDLWLGLEDKPWGRRLAARLGCRWHHAESAAGEHVVERKAGVLAGLGLWDGVTPPPPVRWAPAPGPAGEAAVEALLRPLPAPRVGLQVGSHALGGLLAPRRRRDPDPAWLVALGRALHAQAGAALVVHGGAGGREGRLARGVAGGLAAAGVPTALLAGLDVDALGHALARLDAFVSANTGPAHLAAAVGTPLVLLDGPSTPRAHPWRPRAAVHVATLGLACSPCRGSAHGRACPAPRCLDDLPVARVAAAVRALLGRVTPAAAGPGGGP